MTVLVAAASKYGATQEIAEAIGRVLAECGVGAEVMRVEDVGDVTGYEAVVLGSAVYMGSWLEPARRFVEEHGDELAALPTWLFSSGPTGDPPRPSETMPCRSTRSWRERRPGSIASSPASSTRAA